MDRPQLWFSTNSLQTLCLNRLAVMLEQYSPELLSHVPPTLRHQLFLQSPIVDICRFENTSAFDNIKADKLWFELYDKHWSSYDQWDCDETVTTKSMDIIRDATISNRDKYFNLLTTIMFSAERPTRYFGRTSDDFKRIVHDPKGVMNRYPTDIINYLVAARILVVAGKPTPWSCDPEVEEDPKDVDDYDENWYPINHFPIYQHDLDDDHDDGRLSSNYNHFAAVNQCVPQCYASLVKLGSRISDEDAILLMMTKCNYYPKFVAICASKSTLWSWKPEDLEQLLTKFFCDVTSINLNVIEEPDDEASSIVVTTCFSSPNVSSLYLSFLYELSSLHHLSSIISQLSLKTLHIFSPFDFDLEDNVCKELGKILSLQRESIHELKFHECEFPEEFNFLSNVVVIIQSQKFSIFHYNGNSMSSSVLVQLLNAFFSTFCFHFQQVSLENGCSFGLDASLREFLSPMPLAVCDSSLQYKSLKLTCCDGPLCRWLLGLQPLALQSIHLEYYSKELHSVLEIKAHNDELRVNDLMLVNHADGVYSTDDIRAPLPEDILRSIFKCPLLRSLTLDVKFRTNNLIVITNALQVQAHLGTLKKLNISFSTHEMPENSCDLELLLDAVFNLPQILQFSFHIDILLDDFEIVETIRKYWNTKKKPLEFCFGHYHGLTVSEHIQNLLDEMQLVVKKEYCVGMAPSHSSICFRCGGQYLKIST